MRKSRFSEEQIIAVLREQGAGAATAEVYRRHGVSEQTFYRWKAKHGVVPLNQVAARKNFHMFRGF